MKKLKYILVMVAILLFLSIMAWYIVDMIIQIVSKADGVWM